jgi:hypothetical protein
VGGQSKEGIHPRRIFGCEIDVFYSLLKNYDIIFEPPIQKYYLQ